MPRSINPEGSVPFFRFLTPPSPTGQTPDIELPTISTTDSSPQELEEMAESAQMIFTNELTNLTGMSQYQNYSEWFKQEGFLQYFTNSGFRVSPDHNEPDNVYFVERRTNELFIYMCQELAGQLSHFLQHNEYAKNCTPYYFQDSLMSDDKTSVLGITDFSRRKPQSTASASDGCLSSLASNTSSSMEKLSTNVMTPQEGLSEFDWIKLLSKIVDIFNATYTNPKQNLSNNSAPQCSLN
ncbi:MAG: hypothetical protein KAS93_02080 [Gammaproteobacteria bacterium]|nr:hypothetical protein [Gammaproteobacteria bacterium]